MYDPISVETALVSSGGDLLIQLSDGNVINAGRVRGNPGPKGDTGEQGVRGAHGKDGIDGTNGAKWHTGVGAPELSLGVDGDLYMDVASALLPIFQKSTFGRNMVSTLPGKRANFRKNVPNPFWRLFDVTGRDRNATVRAKNEGQNRSEIENRRNNVANPFWRHFDFSVRREKKKTQVGRRPASNDRNVVLHIS